MRPLSPLLFVALLTTGCGGLQAAVGFGDVQDDQSQDDGAPIKPGDDDTTSDAEPDDTDVVWETAVDDGSEAPADSDTPVDTDTLSLCGNNQLDVGEICDGARLGGATCVSLGLTGTGLACLSDCSDYNTLACGPADTGSFGGGGTATCNNTCAYASDGDCDDGGPNSDYSLCALGSDCDDCGDRAGISPGTATCSETCPYSDDGDCDDGGPGSQYSLCDFGTDCLDCGDRAGISPGGSVSCEDTCVWAIDGTCDDGGAGSSFSVCDLGTDCTDCGPR